MPSIDGLVTGIDTASVIEGLLAAQQTQIDRLSLRKQAVVDEQTALNEVKARLSGVQSQLSQLVRLSGNAFDAKTVTSSQEELVAVAASNDAQPGVYQLRVNSLAKAHQIATQGFARPETVISTGEFGIQVGDGPTTTVTIDQSNNTLRGLADAINASDADVFATVINDGSAEDSYRLMVSSQKTGTANAITLTNNLAATDGGAIQPVFSGRVTTESSILPATLSQGFGAAATPTANEGTGVYTGGDDDTYTFTFRDSGMLGQDRIKLDYTDGSGDHTGSVTIRTGDAGSFVQVAEGLQIKLNSDAVAVAGNSFTVDVTSSDGGVGPAVTQPGYSADAQITSNAGSGLYTGPDDDTFSFRFLDTGVIGRDDVRIAYFDGSGDTSGSLTVQASQAGNFISIADGLQIKLDDGLVVEGQEFSVDVVTSGGEVRNVALGAGYGADATPTVNSEAGSYTGADDDIYTFTVTQGGVVGQDTVEIAYSDGSGDNVGTVSLSAADAGAFKSVAEGLQLKLDSGLAVAGDEFTVNVTAESESGTYAIQEAADAVITIGSGEGALTIRNDTNQIDNVIPGVTLDLLAADVDQDITLTVGNDVEAAKQAVTDFVDAYNDLMQFINEQTRFDTETGEASALLGNRSVSTIQDQIRRAATGIVAGVDNGMNRLSSLGIRLDGSGQLSVNSNRLEDVLNGRVEGVALEDVRKLFALEGETGNANVRFLLGSRATKATDEPYEVEITQAAERASILGSNPLPDVVDISPISNTFQIRIDGKSSSTLRLTEGSYSQTEIASHLESVINDDPEMAGRNISVTVDNDRLRITSTTYGSSSEVEIEPGSALAFLGLQGNESDRGTDVAGIFRVPDADAPGGFAEESATGRGRILTGESDNANTADLQLLVSLTPSQVGVDGINTEVTVTRGIAASIDQTLGRLLDAQFSVINNANDALDRRIEVIDESIDRLNDRFESREQTLLRRFAEMESAIGELQSTGDFLNTQLLSLAGL